jgi:plastocyanin
MSVPTRRSPIALAALSLLALAGCGGGGDGASASPEDSGPPPAATVELQPVTFEPAKVTIEAGETVRWTWRGGVQHDVVGDGFKSELMAKGTFSHTFDEPGTYDYKCRVHPTMKGTVTVS